MDETSLLGTANDRDDKPVRPLTAKQLARLRPAYRRAIELNERITHWCKMCRLWHGVTCPSEEIKLWKD